MQITLSTEQSKIVETLSRQGKYDSLETVIDVALLLLAEEVTEQGNIEPESPEYLHWLEQTRLKIDAGMNDLAANRVVEVDMVLTQLRSKVDRAKAKSA